jgi:hypothetical protein
MSVRTSSLARSARPSRLHVVAVKRSPAGLLTSVTLVIALVVSACAVPVTQAAPDAPSRPGASTSPLPGLVGPKIEAPPVDASLVPVSRSDPGPEAAAVLALCEAAGFDPSGIGGMAMLPSARDLPTYVRLTGQEPEIHLDRPAWVAAYSGRMTLPRGLGWADDPTCVVIDGGRFVFLTGDHGRGDVTIAALDVPRPELALPPLAP